MFFVEDLQGEYERLTAAGVSFRSPPAYRERGASAIFDDTCGNLIQLQQE